MIARPGRGKGQWLRVEVKNNRLTVSIGINTLAFAAQRFYDEEAFESSQGQQEKADFKIVETRDFADSVRRALEREEEDGTTLVHIMFDAAFKYLIEYDAPEGTMETCEGASEGEKRP